MSKYSQTGQEVKQEHPVHCCILMIFNDISDMCWPTKETPGNSVCRAVGLGNQAWWWSTWLQFRATHFCSSHSLMTGLYLCARQKILKFRLVQHTRVVSPMYKHSRSHPNFFPPHYWDRKQTACPCGAFGNWQRLITERGNVALAALPISAGNLCTFNECLFSNCNWFYALLILFSSIETQYQQWIHVARVTWSLFCQGSTVSTTPSFYQIPSL